MKRYNQAATFPILSALALRLDNRVGWGVRLSFPTELLDRGFSSSFTREALARFPQIANLVQEAVFLTSVAVSVSEMRHERQMVSLYEVVGVKYTLASVLIAAVDIYIVGARI